MRRDDVGGEVSTAWVAGVEVRAGVERRYLERHGEVDDDRFPEWDEFQELAADYALDLPQ